MTIAKNLGINIKPCRKFVKRVWFKYKGKIYPEG